MQRTPAGAPSAHRKRAGSAPFVLLAVVPTVACLALGCDMPERHGAAEQAIAPASPPPPRAMSIEAKGTGAKRAPGDVMTAAPGKASSARCVVPRATPAPPVAAPAAKCPADPDGPPVLPRGQVRFVDAPAAPRVSVELALDDAARSRGLMYRTQLGADAGMLFSWKQEEPRSFWMLNTCIPLDMLFIAADGTIVGILEQVPTLNTLPRGVPCPAAHVLEVNAGWTRQHGIQPGQRVEFET